MLSTEIEKRSPHERMISSLYVPSRQLDRRFELTDWSNDFNRYLRRLHKSHARHLLHAPRNARGTKGKMAQRFRVEISRGDSAWKFRPANCLHSITYIEPLLLRTTPTESRSGQPDLAVGSGSHSLHQAARNTDCERQLNAHR